MVTFSNYVDRNGVVWIEYHSVPGLLHNTIDMFSEDRSYTIEDFPEHFLPLTHLGDGKIYGR